MNRADTLARLHQHLPVLTQRFGVLRLDLFGSVARDAAGPDSDVDVLVAFDGPATPEAYFGVQDLLGRPVDLVTDRALRAELRPYVERDAIRIA